MSRAFRLGVLKCDQWLPIISEKFGDVEVQYPKFLRTTGHKIDPKIFSCVEGQFPTSEQIKEIDGFILTGSKVSAYDEHKWIGDLFTSLREINKNQKKIVGICFGHQVCL